jgi:hypothetical protein
MVDPVAVIETGPLHLQPVLRLLLHARMTIAFRTITENEINMFSSLQPVFVWATNLSHLVARSRPTRRIVKYVGSIHAANRGRTIVTMR